MNRKTYYEYDSSQIENLMTRAKTRLFTANYQLLIYFRIPAVVYHLLLLLSFLQICYYVLVDIVIVNEFDSRSHLEEVKPGDPLLEGVALPPEITNLTDVLSITLQVRQENTLDWHTLNFLRYLNYHALVLESGSLQTFYIVYGGHFLFFILTMLGILIVGRRRIMLIEKFHENAENGGQADEQNDVRGEQSASQKKENGSMLVTILCIML